MTNLVDIGVDFGSLHFRAAYMLEGEVVPVPISRLEADWLGKLFTAGIHAAKPYQSESLKTKLGPQGERFRFGLEQLSVEDRVFEFLTHYKRYLEEYTGKDIGRVVIAVPGFYPRTQRSVIQRLADEVGLSKVVLIDDYEAAAWGYTTLEAVTRPYCLLIFSMGFSGFEVGLVTIAPNHYHLIAEKGGTSLSGRDINRLLMETCIAEAAQRNVHLPFLDKFNQVDWQNFYELVEEAKKQLGLGEDVQITLPATLTGKFPLPIQLPVAEFEAAIHGYVVRAMNTVSQVLAEGKILPEQVDKVLLVGGTTRLPGFQSALEAKFGAKLVQPRDNILARGTAVYASGLVTHPKREYQTVSEVEKLQEVVSPAPTPEDILNYAQNLMVIGEYEAATKYLIYILERIQTMQLRIKKQITKRTINDL